MTARRTFSSPVAADTVEPVLLPFSSSPSRSRSRPLRTGHDTPGADDVVGVTSEQGLAIGGPGEGHTLGLAALLADGGELGLELVDLALLLEVEDDDGAGGGSAEPVAVGREDESVDLVVGVEGVQVLGLVKVPEHGGAVLATRSAERTVGGDGDSVNVAGVADVVGLQLAGVELPNLVIRVSNDSPRFSRSGASSSSASSIGTWPSLPKRRNVQDGSGQKVIVCLMAPTGALK